MLFWNYFEREATSGIPNNWNVMVPQNDLERTLLYSLLCEALYAIGVNGFTFRVDVHGMWKDAEEKRTNGINEVEAYFCELYYPDLGDDHDYDEDEAYSTSFVVIRQIEKITLTDGTFKIQVRRGPQILTMAAKVAAIFRSFLRFIGVR